MKRAWSERISQAGRPAQAGWPEQGTLACFFEGVEQLTGQYYPRWRLQQLLEQYESPVNSPFPVWFAMPVNVWSAAKRC